jgi:hypothetical protein
MFDRYSQYALERIIEQRAKEYQAQAETERRLCAAGIFPQARLKVVTGRLLYQIGRRLVELGDRWERPSPTCHPLSGNGNRTGEVVTRRA